MKRLAMMLAAASLMTAAVAPVKANPPADVPKAEKLELSKSAEMRGDVARARENFAVAIDYYRKALKSDGENAVLYNKLGIAELQSQQRSRARKHFGHAVKFDPKYVAAFNNLGAVACLDRKYNVAIRYLNEALAVDETSAPAHLNMAEAWTGLGDIDKAMAEYGRALELDADILSSNAEGTFARVSTPEQRARVAFTIAKAFAKKGNIEGALEYLRRAKEGRFPELSQVYTDQTFASLWEDPRLEKIVKR